MTHRIALRIPPLVSIGTLLLAAMLLAACGSSKVVRSTGGGHRPAKPIVKVSQPKYGATHVVQRGDNVYRIATNNGITPLDLALWNRIPPPYTIYPGQRLRLYPGGPVAARPPAGSPSTGTRPQATPSPPAAAPAKAPFSWRWPTAGQVIGDYRAGDPTRQGIDIAGSSGQAIHAAADGTVVYSGSGLVGYGELVIVKHDEQWLTAYGHNRARLVNEGQIVKAGQQIAEMGRTGAARDMLHFEIRYNGKPVDPAQYLPQR